jgi:hypothetical protein
LSQCLEKGAMTAVSTNGTSSDRAKEWGSRPITEPKQVRVIDNFAEVLLAEECLALHQYVRAEILNDSNRRFCPLTINMSALG